MKYCYVKDMQTGKDLTAQEALEVANSTEENEGYIYTLEELLADPLAVLDSIDGMRYAILTEPIEEIL